MAYQKHIYRNATSNAHFLYCGKVTLSRLGAKVSLASDEMAQAEKRVCAAAQKLWEIQQEIEQHYLTLDDPFGMG